MKYNCADGCTSVMVTLTLKAALKLVLPAWLAVMVQMPAFRMVAVCPLVPLMLHMVGVVDAKVSANPEVAVPFKVMVLLGAQGTTAANVG
jgi:hypothetical protein